MLLLEIPKRELFDDASQTFLTLNKEVLQLEHSLVSLSKWESNWCKPFYSKSPKTTEEAIDYIKCMTITQNVKPETYTHLPDSVFQEVDKYIHNPMTATWFADQKNVKPNKEVITSEIIYYWMVVHNIPMDCQKWHLNRLLTLVRVCNIKNQPAKKQGKIGKDALAARAALNQARKAQFNTKG